MGYFAPREAQTGIPCPQCGTNLLVRRSCQEAHMHCPKCNKNLPLKDFIAKADEPMENFLENIYFDRL